MNKVGRFLFWLQFVVFAAALTALLLFGDLLREYGLSKTTMIVLYMSGLPAVLSVLVLLTVPDKEKQAIDRTENSSPPKSL